MRWRVLGVLACLTMVMACSNGDDVAAPESERDIAIGTDEEAQVADLETSTTTTTAPTTTTTVPERPEAAVLDVPVVGDDPAELAAQITAAEATIRDPDTAPYQLAEAAFLQQMAYRKLGRTPEWDEAVLGAVPEAFHLSVQRNAQARREFAGMHTKLSDTLPAWRIVPPAPSDELLAHYQEAETTFGIEWEYLAAINLVETGMGRIRGTSVAGAQGPMQFIPSTWEAFGEGDVNDPRDAILAAARYLNHNGGHQGNIDGALFNYNRHQNYVRAVKAYAEVMFDDPRTFHGFYHWQILFATQHGDVVLPVGYEQTESIPVLDYLAANPQPG